jgi:hypothetical protein
MKNDALLNGVTTLTHKIMAGIPGANKGMCSWHLQYACGMVASGAAFLCPLIDRSVVV